MRSIAIVRRLTDRTAQDEGSGEEAPVWNVVYTGPFRLGGSERGGSGTRTVTTGGVELQVATRVAHFPAAVTTLADDDLIEVTAGENTGAVLRIVESDWADQQTARRVPVIAADRPGEWA